VLTVSDFAADEIIEVLGVRRERVRVALEAPSLAYAPSDSLSEIAAVAREVGLPPGGRWLTYVGGFNPHKNVDAIIRAHAEVARGTATPPHLVLVGARSGDVFHGSQQAIEQEIARCGTASLVHWTGFLPDERLRHLHSGALALLLPSQCEGFGLPAVEAAACGTPVIATTRSPLPGLLAGGGIFVRPGDHHALVTALRRVMNDEPARLAMGARARQQAGRLSWTRCASATLTALREAAA
jgi:glycosyltransferase involved in cell wall biosynthesis